MNILYICHRFPFPPRRGGKIRPFNMIKHFSTAHRVTVASLVRTANEARDGDGIAPYCAAYEMGHVDEPIQYLRMIARLPLLQPSSMGFFYSPSLARRIRWLLQTQRFDLIFVHCSSIAQYVEDVSGVPKILDFGDMDSQKWLEYAQHKPFPLSLGYRLEGAKMQRAEKLLAGKFDMCAATTRAEWETLNSYDVKVPTDWFPNGVDSDYFSPTNEPYDPNSICFLGRMDYYPNQQCMFDFCTHVLPQIRARRPNAHLQIVGAAPSPAVLKLGNLPGVSVTGWVADVRPFLRRAALSVAPLRIARGTQNKILEAMAAGIPVVTSNAAAGGVDAAAGEHLLVAESPSEQADAVLEILTNPEKRRSLATAGRTRMLSHHSWAHSMQRLDGIVERCVAGYSRAP